MKTELRADLVLVGLGLLAIAAAVTIIAKRNRVSVALVDWYFTLARRAPRWMPMPASTSRPTRGFVTLVRILGAGAQTVALMFSMAGAALLVVGADALE